jgi:crotonobetainyl-CoA:carnitine CoA-transferase CaiB-like acyl-CoA transferase
VSLLAGIRVVELASLILAPSATAIMADFGAEVIKVEPPAGDENRRLHELTGLPRSPIPYAFVADNRSKTGVALDLKHAEGREILLRLVATADVLVTNYRAPALARLHLEWEDLQPLNPRLVYAVASAFGEAGPEAGRPGYDTVVYWARSGIETTLLTPEGTLGGLPPGSGDHPTGLALFGAVMLALYARERSGRGTKVSTSLLAAGAWANACLLQAQLCGAAFPPKRRRDQAVAFGAVYYRTADGRTLKFALVNPTRLWPAFCRAVGHAALAGDPRFATVEARQEHAQALIAILDATFATRDAAYWRERFDAHDVPFAILPAYPEAVADAQMAANGLLVEYDDPRWGRLRTLDDPITVTGAAKAPPRPAPDVGQHTREVLAGLGYSEADIDSLIARRVAIQAPRGR